MDRLSDIQKLTGWDLYKGSKQPEILCVLYKYDSMRVQSRSTGRDESW